MCMRAAHDNDMHSSCLESSSSLKYLDLQLAEVLSEEVTSGHSHLLCKHLSVKAHPTALYQQHNDHVCAGRPELGSLGGESSFLRGAPPSSTTPMQPYRCGF